MCVGACKGCTVQNSVRQIVWMSLTWSGHVFRVHLQSGSVRSRESCELCTPTEWQCTIKKKLWVVYTYRVAVCNQGKIERCGDQSTVVILKASVDKGKERGMRCGVFVHCLLDHWRSILIIDLAQRKLLYARMSLSAARSLPQVLLLPASSRHHSSCRAYSKQQGQLCLLGSAQQWEPALMCVVLTTMY